MTITLTEAFAGPFVANGVTVTFPFTTFQAASSDEIRVEVDGGVIASNAYTVSMNEDGTGSVTFLVAPANGLEVYIVSDPDFTQQVNFETQGPYYQSDLNNPLDRSAIRDLALKRDMVRAIKVPFGQTGGEWTIDADPDMASPDPNRVPSQSAVHDFVMAVVAGYLPLTGGTLTNGLTVPDVAYGAGWNGSGLVPTRNAVYDRIEALLAGINAAPLIGVDGTGATDVSAALQAALDTGRMVYLPAGKVYSFGTQLLPPSGGGFYGPGTLRMLTGAGKFDKADYTGTPFAYSGIYINGRSNVRIQCKIDMEANAGIRTCNPITVNSSTNIELDVEITGFKEVRYGIIEWNTNVGGRVKAYVHDCGTTITTGLPSIQITALCVDGNRIGGINSKSLWFDVHAQNITMSAGAIAAYGYQTDGVNLQGDANGGDGDGIGGHTGFVRAENVLEPLDIFSSHNNVKVTARNCLFGVKIIHGARHNVIDATIDLFQKAGVTINGGTYRTTANNRVTLTATRGGEIGTFGDVTAALIDGSASANGCDNNVIDVTYLGDGVNLDYGAVIGTGNNNQITYEGSGAVQADRIVSGNNNQLRRRRKGHVRAHLNAATVFNNDTNIVFDTETMDVHGEYNPATGVYTAKATTTLRVKTMHRVGGLPSGATFGTYIRKGGAIASRKTDVNQAAGAKDLYHEHTALVPVVPGDTIFIRADSSGYNHTYTAGADTTYIEIEEL